MIRQLIRQITILGLCVTPIIGSATCPKKNGFTIGWESWEPYQFKENNVLTGLDIELLSAIAHKMGCELQFTEVNWKRHLSLVESGDIDLAGGASKTPEREVYAQFSNPYRTERVNLFVKMDNKIDIKSWKDALNNSFLLGVTRGYFYGQEFEDMKKDTKFTNLLKEVTDESDNFKKLVSGYINGVIVDTYAGSYILKSPEYKAKAKMSEFSVTTGDIYVMLSKKSVSPEITAQFNQALDSLKAAGDLDTITKKYTT